MYAFDAIVSKRFETICSITMGGVTVFVPVSAALNDNKPLNRFALSTHSCTAQETHNKRLFDEYLTRTNPPAHISAWKI